jgi:hypothetical protein
MFNDLLSFMREIFYSFCFLSPGAVSASGGGEDRGEGDENITV